MGSNSAIVNHALRLHWEMGCVAVEALINPGAESD